jgi:hypothetical protein
MCYYGSHIELQMEFRGWLCYWGFDILILIFCMEMINCTLHLTWSMSPSGTIFTTYNFLQRVRLFHTLNTSSNEEYLLASSCMGPNTSSFKRLKFCSISTELERPNMLPLFLFAVCPSVVTPPEAWRIISSTIGLVRSSCRKSSGRAWFHTRPSLARP